MAALLLLVAFTFVAKLEPLVKTMEPALAAELDGRTELMLFATKDDDDATITEEGA